jgi:G3E family GTPase
MRRFVCLPRVRSVAELVTLSDMRAETDAFDHIVVELSGVADPKGVRARFQEATFYNMPIMERVCLDTMVTLVDCSVFLNHLKSSKVCMLCGMWRICLSWACPHVPVPCFDPTD